MKFRKIIAIILLSEFLFSCADYKINKSTDSIERNYFSSLGFALIYNDSLYQQKIINKKIKNNEIATMHNYLKVNTPIKIINPENGKFIDTKINKKTNYPEIFNLVITEEIAYILELDLNNPYIEILETKKNKKYVAKEGVTFDEERNVADKAPVNDIKMNDLSSNEIETNKSTQKISKFFLIISDFYYLVSANNLKNELNKNLKANNIYVKKINNNKYRLLIGPFENFNALKTTYISLNNLGFEGLNIYKE